MKVLGIVRTSTERQETESQKKELKEFLYSKGFNDEQIIYIEVAGASARKLNPKYISMLEEIKNTILGNKEIKAVGLWHLNRLGRVESKLLEMKEFFVKNQIQLYVKEQNFELLDPDGNESYAGGIVFSVYSSMVRGDTEEMMSKFARGKQRNIEQGRYNGGNINYGYKVDEEGFIVPDEREMQLVQYVFDLYASGKYTQNEICYKLRGEGYKVRGVYNEDGNKLITPSFIHKIITKKLYLDKGFVTKDIWDKCKKIKDSNKVSKSKETKHANLAIKILKCPECGANYMFNSDRYTCYTHTKHKLLDRYCSNGYCMKAHILDGVLWYQAQILYASTEKKAQIRIFNNLMKEQKRIHNELTSIYQTSTIKKRLELLEEKFIVGDYNEDKYNAFKGKISRELQEEETRIKLLMARLDIVNQELRTLQWRKLEGNTQSLDLITESKDKKAIVDKTIYKIDLGYIEQDGKTMRLITLNEKYKFIYNEWIKKKDVPNVYVCDTNEWIRF